MKTLFCSLIAAAMFFTSDANATDPATTSSNATYAMNAYVNKAGKVNVLMEKVSGKKLTLTLSKADGSVIYDCTIPKKDTQAAMKLDLSELGDGTYKICLSDGETSLTKKVSIQTPETTRTVAVLK